MASSIKKIAIIGSGVIGAGWVIRLLARNKTVHVFEPKITQQKFLLKEIKLDDFFVCYHSSFDRPIQIASGLL